jgi:RND family efflux transporter MFP subunit
LNHRLRTRLGLAVGYWLALTAGFAASTVVANDEPAEPKSVYPVSITHPVPRSVSRVVQGFGTIATDPQTQQVVTAATMVEVRAVHAAPGERVRRGQTLFTVAADPTALLGYQQALTARKLAAAELERLVVQRRDHLATATQVETAEKALADADAGLEAARQQGATAATLELTAPVDGIVSTIAVSTGDRPAAGATLATLAPVHPTRVVVGVEPGAQRLLHVGDVATVRLLPASESPLTARVSVVGSALDKDTRLVPVTLILDNASSHELLGGGAIEASIKTQPVAAYALPRAALVKDALGLAVYEVGGGTAHRRPVTLVLDEGPRVSVLGALDAGRTVATTGAYELEDGVAVVEQSP